MDTLASAKNYISGLTPSGMSPVKQTTSTVKATTPVATTAPKLINGVTQTEYDRLNNLYKTPASAPAVPAISTPALSTPQTQFDSNGDIVYNSSPLYINPVKSNGAIPSTNLGDVSRADVLGTRSYLEKLQNSLIDAYKVNPEQLSNQVELSNLKQDQLNTQNNINNEIDRLTTTSNLTREQAMGFLTETRRRAENIQNSQAIRESALSNTLGNQELARKNQIDLFKTLYGINQPVSVGSNLVNPNTGEVIYQGQRSPVSLSPGETLIDPITGQVIAGGQTSGMLTLSEATQLGVPYGTTREQALGMTPYKQPTEAQSKASGFAIRMQDANSIIGSNSSSIVSQNPAIFNAQVYAEGSSLFNSLASDTIRQQRQAERNFLNAVLRRESGAVISPTEFTEGAKQYFPRPGDDAKTLEQKTRNREVALQSIISEAGNSYTKTQNALQSGQNSSGVVQTKSGTINIDW